MKLFKQRAQLFGLMTVFAAGQQMNGADQPNVMRTDGFVSARAGATESEPITRPLKFSEKELLINYGTSAGGRIQVEIQEESGLPVAGFPPGGLC